MKQCGRAYSLKAMTTKGGRPMICIQYPNGDGFYFKDADKWTESADAYQILNDHYLIAEVLKMPGLLISLSEPLRLD